MDFLFSPESPLFDYLEPFDLLKMLHFTKAARRAAVPKLKAFQAAPQTASQQIMFDEWIENPRVLKRDGMFDEMQWRNCRKFKGAAGPLRFGSIQQLVDTIRERVVLLRYRKTHSHESSCVALFDTDGVFVAYYELESEQYYDTYQYRRNDDDYNPHQPIRMRTTAGFHLPHYTEARWKIREQSLRWLGREGFEGDVTYDNHALFQNFYGLLSPTEATMVLMHAMSLDTRVISVYTLAVFDRLRLDFQYEIWEWFPWIYDNAEDEVDGEMIAMEAHGWEKSLPGV